MQIFFLSTLFSKSLPKSLTISNITVTTALSLSRGWNFTPLWKNSICLVCYRNYQRCFSGIQFPEEAIPVGEHRYHLNLWQQIVGHNMSMNRCGLTTVYKERRFLSDDTFLRPILHSLGFTELRIKGRFWPEMPQIMDTVSTLIRLDLSSNRIKTFTEGKSSFRTENWKLYKI
jgi:hypothetical protein